LHAVRRLTIASLLLLTACTADRAPRSSAPSSASTPSASSPTALTTSTTSTTEPTCAIAGRIVRITVESAALAAPIRVSVVTPDGFDRTVSVVYLLHGASTDETQWEAIGMQAALDDLIATGQPRPFTVVLPDLPSGGDPAADAVAFFEDVIPAVERCLGGGPRTAAHRAVGGISRGGTLALEVAAEHSDAFAAVGGHSPAVADVDQTSLVQGLASSNIRVWLDVGSSDALRPATQQLASALSDAGKTAELLLPPGAHDRAYWSAHLTEYLAWYGQAVSS
jgi:enterochelin esterase family protein